MSTSLDTSCTKLNVIFKDQSQSILIGPDLLSHPERLGQYVEGSQVLIVTNTTVAPLYLTAVESPLIDKQCDVLVLQDGESSKNQDSLFCIYETLISKRHHRDTTLIALGGGVIGDLTGFAAATYQRGVAFIQIPTTLLAQVDAAIGGKVAINHQQAKNVIGNFYQAKAVLMDVTTLKTLPLREFRAGLAEIIKYALLVGGDLLSNITTFLTNLTHPLEKNDDHYQQLSSIIVQCCNIKLEYVLEDEDETKGTRFYLNLGHTIGHALEAYTHYERWLHGEAVAIGLYCIAVISVKYAGADVSTLLLVHELLTRANLPTRIPKDINLKSLLRFIRQDKKIRNSQLNLVLMRSPGECYIETRLSDDDLYCALETAVEQDNV